MNIEMNVNVSKDDRSAFFEKVMNENKGKIFSLGLKILGNKEDAEDLVQDTFMKAYENLHTFKEKSNFSTWLYKVATNCAFLKLREEKLKRKLDSIKCIYKNESLQDNFKNEYLKMNLKNAIETLPSKYKDVFVLHYIEGYSLKEISDMLSIPVSLVKTRIHRCKLLLRKQLTYLK